MLAIVHFLRRCLHGTLPDGDFVDGGDLSDEDEDEDHDDGEEESAKMQQVAERATDALVHLIDNDELKL